jgi:hypothetical protein
VRTLTLQISEGKENSIAGSWPEVGVLHIDLKALERCSPIVKEYVIAHETYHLLFDSDTYQGAASERSANIYAATVITRLYYPECPIHDLLPFFRDQGHSSEHEGFIWNIYHKAKAEIENARRET